LPQPVVALRLSQTLPKPLAPLGRAGRAEWRRLRKIGSVWLSPEADIRVVQMLCEAVDTREELRAELDQIPDYSAMRSFRTLSAIRSIEDQITKWLSALGFTPTARARLGIAEVKAAPAMSSEQMAARARELLRSV
jgi:P27 family predicted phage terminase small subunit